MGQGWEDKLTSGVPRLSEQQGVQQQVGLLQVLADVCIVMQAKHIWAGYDGQVANAVQVGPVVGQVQGLVHPTGAQGVAGLQHGGGVVGLQDCHQCVPVMGVCHLHGNIELEVD